MIGKFENEEMLLKSYSDLEKEFTKKCQELSRVKKELEESRAIALEEVKDGEVGDEVELLDVTCCGEAVENGEDLSENGEQTKILVDGDAGCEEKSDLAACGIVEEGKTHETIIEEDKNLESGLDFRARANEFLIKNADARCYAKEIAKVLIKDKSLLSCSDPFGVAYALVLKERGVRDDKQPEKDSAQDKVAEESVIEVRNEQPKVAILGKNNASFSPVRMVQKFKTMDDAREELIRRFS